MADSHQSMTITLYEQPFIPLLVLKHLKVYNYTYGSKIEIVIAVETPSCLDYKSTRVVLVRELITGIQS